MLKKFLSETQFEEECSKIKNLFFIQIGACDGISFDPINHLVKKYKWSGILVEPGNEAFEALKKNYKHSNNLIFENSAITDKDDDVILYCGSTTPHFTLNYADAVHFFDITPTPVKVKGMTPESLLKKYNVSKVDFLQIDAESHDYVILKNYPFQTHKPSIIRFEYIHLNRSYNDCIDLINANNYDIFFSEDGADIIALSK